MVEDIVVDRYSSRVRLKSLADEPIALVVDKEGNKLVYNDGDLVVEHPIFGKLNIKSRDNPGNGQFIVDNGTLKHQYNFVVSKVFKDDFGKYNGRTNNIVTTTDTGAFSSVVTENGISIISDRDML